MSAVDHGPLAALLSQHPEECAAVAVIFAIMDYQSGGIDAAYAVDEVRRFNPTMPLDNVRSILTAMVETGVLIFNSWGEHRMDRDTRAAIARQGAAAWLRARLSVGDGLPAEIDVDGMVDARGIKFIGKAVRGADGAYLCLANVGGALCRVEVKVTRAAETGAGAPAKGERHAAE